MGIDQLKSVISIFCTVTLGLLCAGCVTPQGQAPQGPPVWRDVTGAERNDGELQAAGIICQDVRRQALNSAEQSNPMPGMPMANGFAAVALANSYGNQWRQAADSAFNACMAERGWISQQVPTNVQHQQAPAGYKSDRCTPQQIRMDECPQ